MVVGISRQETRRGRGPCKVSSKEQEALAGYET